MTTTASSAVSVPAAPNRSRLSAIASWTLTGLAVAFLGFDSVMKLAQLDSAIEVSAQLGFDASDVLVLGVIELVCLIVYLIPTTAILGAVLWTGYLGGAIAIHVQHHNPLFSHVLFPTYIALMLWGGLWLRETRLRALFPLRRS